MSAAVIRAELLGKHYRIGGRMEKYRTLRDAINGAVMMPFRAAQSWRRRVGRTSEAIWALRDVSFTINRGEVVGVIGRNGAGKSTLLKILSRITDPTNGYVEVAGRVGSLLEVGTGFHPELTGRENIFLNGAILGMRKVEINQKFDEIVDFAEVQKFIDTPVKHYSSGMYLRLAFAVAAHLEPDLLLVDEVLAVGDAAFQRKCLGKMGEVAQAGRTVLFVSHNLAAVRDLCQRVLWINDGALVADGEVDDVAQAYLRTLSKGSFNYLNPQYGLAIEDILLKNSHGEISQQFHPGEDLTVEVLFDAKKRIERPYVWIAVDNSRGPCFAANMLLDGHRPEALEGAGRLVCKFKALPLLPQDYTIRMAIRTSKKDAIVAPQDVATFSVTADLRKYGFKGEFLSLASKSTPVVIPYEWILPHGTIAEMDLKSNGD